MKVNFGRCKTSANMAFGKRDLVLITVILTDILSYHGVLSLMCFSCKNQTTITNGCIRMEKCSAGKVCMLKMHTDQGTGAVYYETGCATMEECFGLSSSPVNNGGPAVMGRKRSILVQDITDNQCVLQCCDDDVCNRECLFTTTPSTSLSMTTTTTTTTTTEISTVATITTTTAPPTTPTTTLTTSPTTIPTTTASTVKTTLSTTSPVVTTPTTVSTSTPTSPVVVSQTTNLIILVPVPTKPTPGSTASDLPTKPTPPTTINLITPTTKAPTESTTTAILSTPTSSPKPNCPPGTRTFGSSCYLFVNREMTIRDAEAYCGHHHGYLVHVDSAAENDFLKTVMTEMHRGPVQYWIGINDIETENVWKFNDNQKEATFYDWGPGEPDGKQEFDGHTKADCAVFDPFNNFQWRDEDCSPYQFSDPICELNPN